MCEMLGNDEIHLTVLEDSGVHPQTLSIPPFLPTSRTDQLPILQAAATPSAASCTRPWAPPPLCRTMRPSTC